MRHGKNLADAALLHPLTVDDRLIVAAGGRAELVLFAEGRRYALDGPGTALVRQAELRPVSGKPPAALKSIALPRLGEQPVPARVLGLVVRGGPDEITGPRHPVPNGSVRALTPLKWDGPVEGTELELRVRDSQGVVEKVSLPVAAREYRLPDQRLKPGEYYVWSITSISENGDVLRGATAVVRLLSDEDRQRLAAVESALRAEMKGQPDDSAPALLMARAYEGLGLFDDALDLYRKALAARPKDPGLQAAVRRLAGEPRTGTGVPKG